jgi:hypothetical protein
MKTSTRAAWVIGLFALLSESNNFAAAQSKRSTDASSPFSFDPKSISFCDQKTLKAINSGKAYYMVTIHIPDATTLLTSAPCTSTRCTENDDDTPPSHPSAKTLFDSNLSKKLWAGPKLQNFDKGQILVRIKLDGSSLTLDPGGVNGSNALQQGARDQMFKCRTEPTPTGKSIDVLVLKAVGGAVGSLNVGIDVDESNGEVLPIILDPHVPNNG